jgi:hypothetical protein
MADAGVVDPDACVMVEKRGCGRPCGSKNKSKSDFMVGSSSAPVKWRRGRPVGSKNKPRSSASPSNQSLDANFAHRNALPPSAGSVFFVFAIAGAECREQQRVPLKFTEFMDG